MKRKGLVLVLSLFAGVVMLAGCGAAKSNPSQNTQNTQGGKAMQWSSPPAMTIDQNKTYTALISTNYGDITVQLFAKEAPVTVNNFVFLSRQGFYNGVKFHRIIKTFMIQTGDPTGTGAGGPGYTFKDELPPKHSYDPGIVAMANAGPNTNGSQFFICSGSDARNLNYTPNYTQFGQVISGMDVVQKIAAVPCTLGSDGAQSKPTVDVHINTITITEK